MYVRATVVATIRTLSAFFDHTITACAHIAIICHKTMIMYKPSVKFSYVPACLIDSLKYRQSYIIPILHEVIIYRFTNILQTFHYNYIFRLRI